MIYEHYKEISDPTTFLVTLDDCKFSYLAELNTKISPRHFGEQDGALYDIDTYIIYEYEAFPDTVVYVAAPKPAPLAPVVPDIGTRSTSLINSDDKLVFISHTSPGSSSREWSLV